MGGVLGVRGDGSDERESRFGGRVRLRASRGDGRRLAPSLIRAAGSPILALCLAQQGIDQSSCHLTNARWSGFYALGHETTPYPFHPSMPSPNRVSDKVARGCNVCDAPGMYFFYSLAISNPCLSASTPSAQPRGPGSLTALST